MACCAGVLALAMGCLMVPVPWKSSPAPFAEDALQEVQEGQATRESVRSGLGPPDLTGLEGRYWVYARSRSSGKLLYMPLIPMVDPGATTLNSQDFILFLEFGQDGRLLRRENGQRCGSGPGERNEGHSSTLPIDRYCTNWGLFLEHSVGYPYRYLQYHSPLALGPQAARSVPWPEAGALESLLVLWPNAKDWHGPGGAVVAVEPQDPHSYWLPVGSYLVVRLTAGECRVHVAWVRGDPCDYAHPDRTENSVPITLEPGQTSFMELTAVARNHPESFLPREVAPEKARAMIAEMNRVLTP